MSKHSLKPIRVVLIEDNRYIRSGWEMTLNSEKDFEIAGSFATCEEAFDCERISEADVVLMDINLSGMSGVEGTAYLGRNYPNLAIVICTVNEDDETVFCALCVGAVGFMAKKTPPIEFINELRETAAGRSAMTPKIAQLIIALTENRKTGFGKKALSFSPEEKEILWRIGTGNSYNAIAAKFSLPVTTITHRIRQIYQKLHQHFNFSIKEELL